MEESSEQDIRKSVFCKFHWMSQLSVTASSWVLRGPMIQILPEGWVPPGAASASAGWREVSENPSGILQHSLSLPMLLCQLKSNLTSKTCWWESCLKTLFFLYCDTWLLWVFCLQRVGWNRWNSNDPGLSERCNFFSYNPLIWRNSWWIHPRLCCMKKEQQMFSSHFQSSHLEQLSRKQVSGNRRKEGR